MSIDLFEDLSIPVVGTKDLPRLMHSSGNRIVRRGALCSQVPLFLDRPMDCMPETWRYHCVFSLWSSLHISRLATRYLS